MEACEAQHMFRPLHWCSLAGSASAKQLVEMALHGMRGSKAKQLNTETSDAPLQVGAWEMASVRPLVTALASREQYWLLEDPVVSSTVALSS